MNPQEPEPQDQRARVAIDLGAESCRVSLLQWTNGNPRIQEVHRIPNGPVHIGSSLHWPLKQILAGLQEGLRKAAERAPEGVASIGVDGWAVDYVRLDPNGQPLREPFCYRDERTVATKDLAKRVLRPEEMFRRTGAQPLRINTVYQLIADRMAGLDTRAPWVRLPEYVLHWLGGRRVAEYTNATHTGLVDLATGEWSRDLFERFEIPLEAASPIVPTGTIVGQVRGPLTELTAFHNTELIAPACHDTASAIAGISLDLSSTAYICSGTWSLVGTLVQKPIASPEAMRGRYTNQGAACGSFCFHTNVNGMWLIKQCMNAWAADGRAWSIESLIQQAALCHAPGVIDVDSEPLLLDNNMPERINDQLKQHGFKTIPDTQGNEPIFARLIFESLAHRYATAVTSLEKTLGRRFDRIHILGGGSRNKLLAELTAKHTGLSVESGHPESSTIGNFAVQLATIGNKERSLGPNSVRRWAARLSAATHESKGVL